MNAPELTYEERKRRYDKAMELAANLDLRLGSMDRRPSHPDQITIQGVIIDLMAAHSDALHRIAELEAHIDAMRLEHDRTQFQTGVMMAEIAESKR